MANDRLYRFWGSLTEGLRTGRPQNETKTGGRLLRRPLRRPGSGCGFLQAMTGLSTGAVTRDRRASSPGTSYETFVDVGTARGRPARARSRCAHAHLTGGGFDLPAVGPLFDEYVAGSRALGPAALPSRRASSPTRCRRPTCSSWGTSSTTGTSTRSSRCSTKAYEALPEGGALIVYDAIIDDERRTNAFGLLMSLNMLIETPGGFDYTGADCQRWMREVGFRDTRVEHLAGPDSMVVGIK